MGRERRLLMKTRLEAWVVVWVLVGSAAVQAGPLTQPGPGMWSATASYLWPGETAIRDYAWEGREIRIPSPHKRYSLLVSGSDLTVVDQQDGARKTLGSILIFSLAEVEWSPDSSGFYVNQSDGGWVGSWSVSVYGLQSGRLVKLNAGQKALTDFSGKTREWCPDEFPNMAAAGWAHSGQAILLVGEAPRHSSCPAMGRLYGYLVSITDGRILAEYDEVTLNKRWGKQLGPRLRRGP